MKIPAYSSTHTQFYKLGELTVTDIKSLSYSIFAHEKESNTATKYCLEYSFDLRKCIRPVFYSNITVYPSGDNPITKSKSGISLVTVSEVTAVINGEIDGILAFWSYGPKVFFYNFLPDVILS